MSDLPRHPAPDGHEPEIVQGRSHIWRAEIIRDIQAKAELGRYQIRGFSTFQKFPSLDELVFLPAAMTRLPLEGYREHCDSETTIGGGRPDLVSQPLELAIPVYLTSMSFGALGTNAKMALGMGFSRAGLGDLHRRGGHARGGARRLDAAHLPDDPFPLRARSRAPAQGRRDRDRGRSGREAGDGRDAARHEGLREGRGHAHAAGRRRPALRGTSPRFPGCRRPAGQDHGAQGGDRLPHPDHPQAARVPRSRGREDRRQDRLRRDRRRRHRGLDGCGPRVPARSHGHPDARGDPGRTPRARGDRHVRQGDADRLRRDPQRRRRREGARARCGLRRHRHRRARRARLQRAPVRRGLPRARHRARRVPPLPHRPLPGRDHDPGPGARSPPRSRGGRRARPQLPHARW